MTGKEEKIRPVGYLRITQASKSHIPILIRRETSVEPGEKIPYVINARTVLLYDSSLSADELVESLEVLKRDILLRSISEIQMKRILKKEVDLRDG